MAYTDRDLSNLTISESFWRLMQTDPVDDRTLIDGTGSLVTHLTVSGTVEAYYFKGDGSQLENLPSSSLPAGLVSSSAQLGLSPSDSPTFANLTIDGKLTAQEFHTEYVSASIIYESGSTKFGDSLDDIHSFTGSIRVDGDITGSLFGTASYADFSTTSSYIDPLFISASVVALGLSGASEWDEVQNKPAGLVSSSAQTIANLFGTNIVSGSDQRGVLGLAETDSPTFDNGNFTGNVVVDGTLTARTYIVSSSVIDYQTIQVSGSTKFGDSLDDIHQFTGSINVLSSIYSPSITGSLQGTASYALTASFAENANFNTGSFATTASNVFFGDQTVNGNFTVTGKITAEEFYTEYVSASIIYESGSTKFGDTLDDIHSFTGSLRVSGSITGSLFGTSSYSNFSTTSSYINPLFISASVAALGLSGASEWDQIQNKPDGLVSSSAQTIQNLVETNIVSGSGQRGVLGLAETDSPTFANGNFTGNVVVGGTLTAKTYIVSSSIVDYQTIQISGSTKFGDTIDDIHQFTGSLSISGSLTIPSKTTLPVSAEIGSIAISNGDAWIYM